MRVAIGGMLTLALALFLIWPLGASANHPTPTLPLVASHVESISDCAPPPPDIGTAIPTGQVGNASTPPDRNNTSSSNESTTGSVGTLVIHANAESDPKELTLDVSGSHNVFDGQLDSRSHAKVGGSWNLFRHGFEYGQRSEPGKVAFDLTGSNNCFSPGPEQEYENAPPASPAGFPLKNAFDPDEDGNVLEHFAPGTTAATAAMNDPTPGPQYFVCGIPDPDAGGSGAAVAPGCSGSGASAIMDRNVQGQALERGLYFVTGRIKLSASNLNARITMVSGQQLNVNGSFQGQGVSVFTPYTDASGAIFGTLLFASQWDEAAPLSGPTFPDGGTANDSPNTDKAEDALKIEGSLSRFEGINVATNGRAEISGEQLDFRCPVMGDRVRVNGSKNYFNATGCGRPGISVSKVPDGANVDGLSGTVNLGDLAKFKITVTNSGTEPLTDIDLDDVLPGVVPPNWVENPDKTECTVDGGNDLHCDIPSLAVGASFSVTLERTTVASDCLGDTGAGVKLDNGSDTAQTDDDATATAGSLTATDPGYVLVKCPDAGVQKAPDGGFVNAGGNIQFTINVTTNGPGPSPNVQLTDTLPAGFLWTLGGTDEAACVADAGGDGNTETYAGGTTLTCNFGTIPFPGSRTVTLTAPTASADCGRVVNNSATITGAGDRVASNNTDVADVTVRCGALRILKQSTKPNNPLVSQPGTVFSVTGLGQVKDNNNPAAALTDASSTVGEVCIENVAPGEYTVSEVTPPTGYGAGSAVDATATVTAGTNCTTTKPADANSAIFRNPPLGSITVQWTDGGSGETKARIDCAQGQTALTPTPPDGTPTDHNDTSETYGNLTAGNPPIVYTCTISADP